MNTWVARNPPKHLEMLVGRIVVGEQTNLLVRLCQLVGQLEKPQPLLMPVPIFAHTDHRAIERIHRRKKRRSAAPLIVIAHRAATPPV